MRIAILWGVIGVLVLSTAAIVWERRGEASSVGYRTAQVERGDVQSSASADGVLQPLTVVDVESNAGGKVEQMRVEVGEHVRKGQVIARIDPTDSRTQFEE